MQPSDRFVEEDARVEHERHELAHLHAPVQHLHAAHPEHQTDSCGADELHAGPVVRPGPHDHQRAPAEIIGALREAFILVRLAPERLDLPNALEVVHQQGVHRARRLALETVTLVRRQRVPKGTAHQKGQGNQSNAAQQRTGHEHEHQRAGNAQQRHGSLLDAVDQQPFHVVHVFNHPGHQVSRGALVEPGHRQPLQPGIDMPAHVEDHILLERVVDPDADAVEQFPEKERPEQADGDRREQVSPSLSDHVVNDHAGQPGIKKAERKRENRAAHGGHGHPQIGLQIHAHAADHFTDRTRRRAERGIRVRAVAWMGSHSNPEASVVPHGSRALPARAVPLEVSFVWHAEDIGQNCRGNKSFNEPARGGCGPASGRYRPLSLRGAA